MDEGGCIAWLVIWAVGLTVAAEIAKKVIAVLLPWLPLLAAVGAIGTALWLSRHRVAEAVEQWWKRYEVRRAVRRAQAEIREVHAETARRMDQLNQRREN